MGMAGVLTAGMVGGSFVLLELGKNSRSPGIIIIAGMLSGQLMVKPLMPRRATRPAFLASVCLWLLAGCATPKLPMCGWRLEPPKTGDLVGVWIGFDEDELDFMRLDLRSSLKGYCACVAPADTSLHDYGVQAYRVTYWTLDGWKLIVNLTPATTNAEPIYLRGTYEGNSLRLETGGTNGNWKRKVILTSESRTDGANREVRDKIKELEGR